MPFKKLYIVTGKGGVGKTMTALALSKALAQRTNKKVYYNSFDVPADQKLCAQLGVDTLDLPLYESTVEYIGRKLGNKSIAGWIMKAPFFKALFNIVPSLGNMITLGHIIDLLEDSDDTIIVCDAPSSGHLLTVLESPRNFNQIFKTGALVKDIHRMLNFLQDKEAVQTWVISIPTELAVTEGKELIESLNASGMENISNILNNVLSENKDLQNKELPQFLQNKLKVEKEVVDSSSNNFSFIFPMFIDKTPLQLVKRIEETIVEKILK